MPSLPLFDLTGRRAFITGSSRGIGLAYAHAVAEHGAEVVLNSLNPDDVGTKAAWWYRVSAAPASRTTSADFGFHGPGERDDADAGGSRISQCGDREACQ